MPSPPDDGAIAIIGMAGVFPQAPSVAALWDNVLAGVDALSEATHWDESFRCGPGASDGDRVYTRRGGWLGDALRFDPTAYGVMPRAVDGGEPEHFVALRLAHEALADAGYRDRDFPRERTAVILGRGTYVNRGMIGALQHGIVVEQTVRMFAALQPGLGPDALDGLRRALHATLPPFNAETAASLSHSAMCGRIANRLDLMGPAYTIDAACASSLIALEQAAKELRSGACDLALAGGIQISTTFPIAVLFCELGALSRTGRLRSFHPKTDGTLLGEAAGILVLKRLADADRDGDRVYAVVRGVGVASDGRALGVLAPRVEGEELAMRRAYAAAGLPPESIGLVEAHGTGTPAGDATELEALRRVFGARAGRVPTIALGSIKSMIGHSIPAAGVAGLVKAALALHQAVLPPTLHADVPQPKLADSPFYLNGELRPWVHGADHPRRAAVSAFGFGGINAHVVLEEHRPRQRPGSARAVPRARATELFVVSAATREGLVARCEALAAALASNAAPSAADLAYTLACEHDPAAAQCLAVIAGSLDEFGRKLGHVRERLADPACARIKDRSGIFWFRERLADAGGLAFCFPGEGAQYEGMLSDLCVHFPAVRACFDRMDRALGDAGRDAPPSSGIFPPPAVAGDAKAAGEGLWAMDAAVEAVFTADQAMHALLAQLGLRPDAVVGHSSGEYSAIIASGAARVGSDEQVIGWIRGMRDVGRRAEEGQLVARGTLLAVAPTGAGQVERAIAASGGALEVAMDNCPRQVVLCGPDDAVTTAMTALRADGAICQRLPFDRAYHTPRFAPFCDAIRPFFAQVELGAPEVPLWSCVTAAAVPPDPDALRELAIAQWARPVRFRETIEAMWAAGIRLFVEVGPRGNLTAFVDDVLGKRPHLAVAANVPKRAGLLQLHQLLGLLAAHGVHLDLPALHAGRGLRRLPAETLWGGVATPAARDRGIPLSLALPVLRTDERVRRALGSAAAAPSAAGGAAAADATAPRAASIAAPAHGAVPDLGGATALPAVGNGGAPAAGPPDARGPAPTGRGHAPGAMANVMAEYLRGMDEFLATQEAVMQAFLGAGGAGGVVRPAVAPPHEYPATLAVALPAPVVAPPAALVEHPPATPAAGGAGAALAASAAPGPVAAASLPTDREGIAALLRQLVGERTGYPADMLDFGLHLEADLGIDSIKRVEILGALDAATGLVGDDVEGLTGLKTLREVVDALATRLDRGGTAGTGASGRRPAAFAPRVVRHDVDGSTVMHVTLSLAAHRFLVDHPLGGRVSEDASVHGLPVCPLAMTLELAVEAAAAAVPAGWPVGLRAVRAGRWLGFTDDTVELEATVRPRAEGELQVVVRRLLASGQAEDDPPVLACLVRLASEAPATAAADAPEPLADARPGRWAPTALYGEGEPHGMFHGPTLRGVAAVEAVGERGADGVLRALSPRGLFAADDAPALAFDPVLLDAAGQVLGFWNADVVDPAVVLFPVAIEEVVLGPRPAPGTELACHVRVRALEAERIVADITVADAAGRRWLQLRGWETRRFHLPAGFFAFRLGPRDAFLASALEGALTDAGVAGVRFEPPAGFLETDGGIWREAMAHLVLGTRERAVYRALRGPDARRRDWLLGRVAAKDAVRLLMLRCHGVALYPADIEIVTDAQGRPHVEGAWIAEHAVTPVVSLSHSSGIAVAIAAEGRAGAGIGIDLERIGVAAADFERVAFDADERALLADMAPERRAEWGLRFWCAKESVAKALGRSDAAGPRDALVHAPDVESGQVRVRLAGELAAAFPLLRGAAVTARTLRHGDAVLAVALLTAPKEPEAA